MGEKLKSSLEIAMEKTSGVGEAPSLAPAQKEEIARIRRETEAKIAEKKILLGQSEELPWEIRRLQEQQEERIQKVYEKGG